MSKPMTFRQWFIKKFIEYGHDEGGFGWIRYWMLGLIIIGVISVTLHMPSILISYFGGTIAYLIYRAINNLWESYIKEVYGK